MPALTEIIGSTSPPGGGASSAELTALKTDVADLKSSLKPIIGRTVYTTATVLNAEIGDEIHIDGEGTIQFPAAPNDGADIFIFDELGKIKENKNNILLGAGDRWRMRDGTFETTALIFDDDQLRRGWMRFKYTVSSKSWWPYVHYGTAGTSSGTGLSEVQHDAAELNPLSISSKPSVQFHLEGGGGAKIDSSLPDGWWGTVLNTTNDPQPISFDADLTVFLRDGNQIDTVESPYQLEGNSVVTLQMVDNGFKFLQIIPNGGGGKAASGDRIETATLSTLPANTWANWPSLAGADATAPLSLDRIESATGEDFTNRLEVDRAAKRVRSLTEHDDLKFFYEVHGVKASDGGDRLVSVVLSELPPSQWTAWPVLTGTDAGKPLSLDLIKSSTGEDLTNRLEVNRSTQRVRSLTRHQNVQFVYEVH